MSSRQPQVDLELPQEDSTVTETVPLPADEPKIKFREKKVDKLGQDLVAFRKRKMAARQQRSLRAKDDDT